MSHRRSPTKEPPSLDHHLGSLPRSGFPDHRSLPAIQRASVRGVCVMPRAVLCFVLSLFSVGAVEAKAPLATGTVVLVDQVSVLPWGTAIHLEVSGPSFPHDYAHIYCLQSQFSECQQIHSGDQVAIIYDVDFTWQQQDEFGNYVPHLIYLSHTNLLLALDHGNPASKPRFKSDPPRVEKRLAAVKLSSTGTTSTGHTSRNRRRD